MNAVDSFGEELVDGHCHVGVDLLFYVRGHYPYALDWRALVEMGQRGGVGRFVVFPMVSHLALDLERMSWGRLGNGKERIPYAFENRRLMAEIGQFPEIGGRALPLWMIDPSREQKDQVLALRGLSEEFRCFGLKIQATINRSFVADLIGAGQCLLDLAEEKNWPVIVHSSVDPKDCWSQTRDILVVAEARPNVRFCLAHSCRFDEASLDAVASLPNAWFDCSAHRSHCWLAVQNHPAIAAKGRRFETDYQDPGRVLADLAKRYPEKLIWGSDAPFESYLDKAIQVRSSYEEEIAVLRQLDREAILRVAGSNTQNFLGI